MRYVTLFEVSIRHGYDADAPNADFALRATDETERLVRNHRLTALPRPGGVRVVTPVDGAGHAFIPFDGDETFVWELLIADPRIAAVTDPASLDVREVTRFANVGPAGSELLVATAHPAPESVAANAVGCVEITLDHGERPVADPAPSYVLRFEAASTWWSYYLLTDLPTTAGVFSIVDGDSPALTFAAANARDLVADPDPADELAASLAARNESLRLIRFRSDEPVVARRAPRRDLQLRLDDEPVVTGLTNPSPSSRTVLSVTVEGHDDTQSSLAHVLRYPNRPPANQGV